jgi:hypothetical protein
MAPEARCLQGGPQTEAVLSERTPIDGDAAAPHDDNCKLLSDSDYDTLRPPLQPGRAAAEANEVRRGAGTDITDNTRDQKIRDFNAETASLKRDMEAIDREAALLPPPTREERAAGERIYRNLTRMFPWMLKQAKPN